MPKAKTSGTFTLGDRQVNRMGYGAMQLAGPGIFGPPKERSKAIAVLREAVESGVNHIDTSDYYGPYVTNQIIREALHPYQDELTIVTKVGAARGSDASWNAAQSPAELVAAVHDNLRNLNVDGNLALILASRLTGNDISAKATLVGVVALSPVTDLTLSSETYATRADADPLFTRAQVSDLVHSYLRGADPKHPHASPLHAPLIGLPPVRIHVGDDEVLLDDSREYVQRAIAAGVDARVDVWMGMSHGFAGRIGVLKSSGKALQAIGVFLREKLQSGMRS
jgi:hypothetical protein